MSAGPRSVTVVIPTILRPSLQAAIASVREQTHPTDQVEVVVVVDRAEDDIDDTSRRWLAGADRVVVTGGGLRGGNARNQGVEHGRGDLVAFLDDDDLWSPGKLSSQIDAYDAALARGVAVPLVSCQVRQQHAITGATGAPLPRRPAAVGQPVADYLFRRRRISSARRALVLTSCLLVSREAALRCPWDGSLRRHQDWDWIVRLEQEIGAALVQVPEALVTYRVGSPDSISATPDWEGSLDWALGRGQTWAAQTYVDFLVAQPLRYALQARSFTGVQRVLRAVLAARRLPNIEPLVIGVAGMLSRRRFETLSVSR